MTQNESSRGVHACTRDRLLRSLLSVAIVSSLALARVATAAPAAPASSEPPLSVSTGAPTSVMGQIGDPASWRSPEFLADWGLSAIGADYAYARGLTGAGIAVGVFDSGTFAGHPEFAGDGKVSVLALGDPACATYPRVVLGGCFYSRGDRLVTKITVEEGGAESPSTLTYDTHGTHVAGTVAANRDGQGMQGVAFASRLIVGRALADRYDELSEDSRDEVVVKLKGASPEPNPEDIADYYNLLSQQHVGVTNHSFGLPTKRTDTLEDVREIYLANQAYLGAYANGSIQHGILTVFAAGNDAGAIADVYAGLPAFRPDVEPYWLSVVNVRQDDNGSYSIDPSSSVCAYTQRWCVSAPGSGIYSAVVANNEVKPGPDVEGSGTSADPYSYTLPDHEDEPGYANQTGTSMAAPHVTGALGLLFERYPYLTAAQVRDVLLTTTTPLGPADIYGWGLINLAKAIDGPGQFLDDTVVTMNRPAGGAKVWQGDAWDDWSNDIAGPGRLTKAGIGWLRLSGDNTFGGASVAEGILELNGSNQLAGSLTVDGGELLLNGSLHHMQWQINDGLGVVSATGVLDNTTMDVQGGAVSFNGTQLGGSTWVGAGGFLNGTGRLADTRVEGTIAPGNPGGTLTVNGDYAQTGSATFIALLAPGGISNRLSVTGTAALDGGLQVSYAQGRYLLGDRFNIIEAKSGVQGQFASVEGGELSTFLKFVADYRASGVDIQVARAAGLITAATTPNQRAVAARADALPFWQGLARPLTQLLPEQVPGALDALSGDLYASLPMVLIENSRWARDAALNRAKDALMPLDANARTGFWVQALTGNSLLRGNDNAALAQTSGDGWLVGFDHAFEQDWLLGIMGGVGHARTNQGAERDAKANLRNRSLSAYMGKGWGPWSLRAGLGYAHNRIESERGVSFPGFSDRLSARYHASTRQGFVEGAYAFRGNQWSLEPYLQYARVGVSTDGIQESGGPAALHGNVGAAWSNFATLGVRYDLGTISTQRDWMHVRAGLGYRYASGDLSKRAYMAWSGGDVFGVSGAPIAKNAMIGELGVMFQLTPHQQLELGGSGQYGGSAQDYGANARWTLQF